MFTMATGYTARPDMGDVAVFLCLFFCFWGSCDIGLLSSAQQYTVVLVLLHLNILLHPSTMSTASNVRTLLLHFPFALFLKLVPLHQILYLFIIAACWNAQTFNISKSSLLCPNLLTFPTLSTFWLQMNKLLSCPSLIFITDKLWPETWFQTQCSSIINYGWGSSIWRLQALNEHE